EVVYSRITVVWQRGGGDCRATRRPARLEVMGPRTNGRNCPGSQRHPLGGFDLRRTGRLHLSKTVKVFWRGSYDTACTLEHPTFDPDRIVQVGRAGDARHCATRKMCHCGPRRLISCGSEPTLFMSFGMRLGGERSAAFRIRAEAFKDAEDLVDTVDRADWPTRSLYHLMINTA